MRVALAMGVLLLTAGCGGSSGGAATTGARVSPSSTVPSLEPSTQLPAPSTAACAQAFAKAAAVPDAQSTQEDLYPTFSACASYQAWAKASAKHAELHGVAPATFAANQCAYVSALGQTPVCLSLP